PAKMSRSMRGALLRMAPAAVTIVGVAALLRVVYDPWYLNYDARYALLWARDVWHGFAPDFEAGFAPTPHPLSTLVSSLGLPFGHSGDAVSVWIVLLSFGALVWLTYRLGTVLFSTWVGAAAALVVLTRPVLGRDVLLPYQDVPFAALIVGAVLLEAQQRRRGASLDVHVLRVHAARAGLAWHPGRPVVCMAARPLACSAAFSCRGRHDARVRDRAGVRPAAGRQLHTHAGRAVDAFLRARAV